MVVDLGGKELGEAARRKKLDPNFGKRAKNQLEVKLDQDLVLPENLEKVKQALSEKGETS